MKTITLDDELAYFLEIEMYLRAKAYRERAATLIAGGNEDYRPMHDNDIRDAERCESIEEVLEKSWYTHTPDVPPPTDDDRHIEDASFYVSHIASGPRGREIGEGYATWM